MTGSGVNTLMKPEGNTSDGWLISIWYNLQRGAPFLVSSIKETNRIKQNMNQDFSGAEAYYMISIIFIDSRDY